MKYSILKWPSILVFMFLVSVGISSCEKLLTRTKNSDPISVFDDLWNFVDDHYALFELKGVDWSAIREKYRGRISENTSESELFTICAGMLEELKDGHVTLISPFKTATYDNFYRLFPVNFNYQNIVRNYLKNSFEKSGPFIFKIDQGVGYLYYSSFGLDYTDDDINKVFRYLEPAKGLILDVRSNTGGKSVNVDRLASRFVPSRKLMKYEVFKSGPGHAEFLAPQSFYLSPAKQFFSKPVVLLTNRTCFSACNDFALYMSELEQVKLVGDQTGGGGSVPANYLLLNGWKLQYSATLTLNINKEPVEQGIVPDFPITNSLIDESNGIDAILEKAFSLLK